MYFRPCPIKKKDIKFEFFNFFLFIHLLQILGFWIFNTVLMSLSERDLKEINDKKLHQKVHRNSPIGLHLRINHTYYSY